MVRSYNTRGRGVMLLGEDGENHMVSGPTMNEVETIIMRHGGVQDACVVPRGKAVKGRALYALILPKPGFKPDPAMMLELMKLVASEGFEHHEIPTRWRAVRHLPESPRPDTRRWWLRSRKSLTEFLWNGHKAVVIGEGDWEQPQKSIALIDPVNLGRFEGALTRVHHSEIFGQPCIWIDLAHHIKRQYKTRGSGGGNRARRAARFWVRDAALMRLVDNAGKGARMLVGYEVRSPWFGKGNNDTGPGPVRNMLEAMELEVLTDFKRTPLDLTDDVFAKAL